MLCSNCNKNVAVVFINKIDQDGQSTQGLCYQCAKEKGINPMEVLAKQANLSPDELKDMSKQFENLFEDLVGDLNDPETLEKLNGFNNIDLNSNDSNNSINFSFQNLISNMFGNTTDDTTANNNNDKNPNNDGLNLGSIFAGNSDSNTRKKVKVEKKNKHTKKKYLVTYATNLTYKAFQNKVDEIVGRDKELIRLIQILNRLYKTKYC